MGMTECSAYTDAQHQQNTDDTHTYESLPYHSQVGFTPDHPGALEHSKALDSDPPKQLDHSDFPNYNAYVIEGIDTDMS